MPFDPSELEFDPDALRARYRHERDRRIRPERLAQYVEIAGEFKRYDEDPHADPGFTRDPLTDDVDALIIGGGIGGLCAAARLREAGLERIRVIDKAGDFGGTWYWNRYPGAQCDTESLIYLPLLEETGYMPTERYVHAPEIRAHCRRIGEHFDLYGLACFQTEVGKLTWLDDRKRWLVETDRGDAMTARHVVVTNGPMNRPKLPGIPGIETFRGHSFHTSRWDFAYTGGDSSGGLTGLADKRVGLIGTGATAIQVVPHLGEWAKQLHVFQRTPTSIEPRNNRPTDPAWFAALAPGWQQRRMENFTSLTSGNLEDEDQVADGWTDIVREVRSITHFREEHGLGELSDAEVAQAMEIADFRKMNRVRARMEQCVKDPATAEALKPWYRLFCKRPAFHDGYLPAFNRPNVTLVDTGGRGVERIEGNTVFVDGKGYEVDCLVYATGFEVGTEYKRRTRFTVHGRGGLELTELWAESPKTLHGFYTAGFPNLFHMGVGHNTLTLNFPHLLDWQSHHIADLIALAGERGAAVIEPTEEAQEQWCRTIRDHLLDNQQFRVECTPGYYNGEGTGERGVGYHEYIFGKGPVPYFNLVREWREAGMPGLIWA